MKVYVVLEVTDETGAREFDYSLFSTFEKAKKDLERRNKELYKSYDVERNLQYKENEYYAYDEIRQDISYEELNGDGYWLRIEEREVR